MGALEKQSVDGRKAAGKKMRRVEFCMASWVCDPYNKRFFCMVVALPRAPKRSKNLQGSPVRGN